MKIDEIRKKSEKELQKLLAEQRNELREMKFKVSTRQLKNYKKINQVKHDIARILMAMKEKNQLIIQKKNKV